MRFAAACVAMALSIICILASLGDEASSADASEHKPVEAVSAVQD